MSLVHSLVLLAALLCAPAVAGAQGSFVNWESPHVHPLEATPDGARLLAVNTADNRLEVFDLTRDPPQLLAEIPVGLDPVSVRARSNDEAWVVNHVSDTISIVRLDRRNTSATLATDDEPCDVVFAGGRAFVSCAQPSTVLVYDPANLQAAPVRVPMRGEDPRALAVSAAGDEVYVALFSSGNQTTILGGEANARVFPPDAVSDPDGPYGGVNPPPNAGDAFAPPLRAGLPPPPSVGLIVRRAASGQWLDDNGGDWTRFVNGDLAARSGRPLGWTLLDHDVAILDSTTLALRYADGLMNLDQALAVHPSGSVTVVGTEATNEIRFEPNLTGRFVRAHLARFAPDEPGAATVRDLNPHLDYSSGTLPLATRRESLSDPRGIVWSRDGARAYVSGMGSNNVVVLGPQGERLGAPIEVGEGPTGIVLDEGRGRLYVLAKFEAALSVVDTTSEREVKRLRFFDPTPSAIRRGRRHLYDAHETSGTGLVSCSSCHVDARMDRLAWDLGNPQGVLKPLGADQNLDGNIPGENTGFEDWHPMKGPMLTQTLQDIVGHEPLHWRGDKDGLEEFNPAFVGLLGDDAPRSASEMQEFEDFLATIAFPPNPFRKLDNGLPNSLDLPGHFRSGRFGRAGEPMPRANPIDGRNYFRTLLDQGTRSCLSCHTQPTGLGTDRALERGVFVPLAPGPHGENHCALTAIDGVSNVTLKTPQLRNLYQRVGFELTQLENTAGFGFGHDGSVDSLSRFFTDPAFHVQSEQRVANLIGYMLAFSGELEPTGSLTDVLKPLGPLGLATHAAVGEQVTLDSPPDAGERVTLDAMIALADQEQVGLVVHGLRERRQRGWTYLGANLFQSDRALERHSRAELESSAGPSAELTFTLVPQGSQKRIGVDRDAAGALDGDSGAGAPSPH